MPKAETAAQDSNFFRPGIPVCSGDSWIVRAGEREREIRRDTSGIVAFWGFFKEWRDPGGSLERFAGNPRSPGDEGVSTKAPKQIIRISAFGNALPLLCNANSQIIVKGHLNFEALGALPTHP